MSLTAMRPCLTPEDDEPITATEVLGATEARYMTRSPSLALTRDIRTLQDVLAALVRHYDRRGVVRDFHVEEHFDKRTFQVDCSTVTSDGRRHFCCYQLDSYCVEFRTVDEIARSMVEQMERVHGYR